MSTSAQTSANQANAQHSTGPRSEAGKIISSQNRLKYGLTGSFVLLPTEDPRDYEALLERFQAEYQPATATEHSLVVKLAQYQWLSQRALRFQTCCFDTENYPAFARQLELLMRYQTTHDRAFARTLSQLQKVQKGRQSLESGVEASKASAILLKEGNMMLQQTALQLRIEKLRASLPSQAPEESQIGFESQNDTSTTAKCAA